MADSIIVKDARFIFGTNFAGDPKKDAFKDPSRKAMLVIPDANQAQELADMGVNVKKTKPREDDGDEFEPTYFVKIKANYDSTWPPKIYLVTDDATTMLNADTIGMLDDIRVKKVNVVLNPWHRSDGGCSLFVKTMYVEQYMDDDPFYGMYRKTAQKAVGTNYIPDSEDDDELPF